MAVTNNVSSTNRSLPNDVIGNIIFPNLSLSALATCSLVCKAWNKMAQEHINSFSHPHAFGPKEWYIYFGCRITDVPRLPFDIEFILKSPCPFWPDKKVHETHVLCLIPQTVKGKPLNLKLLGELVQMPMQGNTTKYNRFFKLGEYNDSCSPKSHWALLTRDVIEGSRSKPYSEQQALIQVNPFYEVPTILDATVCIFMEYVRTSTRLYAYNPWTYTRCQEKYNARWQLVVGGFTTAGLIVYSFHFKGDSFIVNEADEYCGVGGLRKF
jgi:hypothetical protein